MPTINEFYTEELIEKELHSPDEPMQMESTLDNVKKTLWKKLSSFYTIDTFKLQRQWHIN